MVDGVQRDLMVWMVGSCALVFASTQWPFVGSAWVWIVSAALLTGAAVGLWLRAGRVRIRQREMGEKLAARDRTLNDLATRLNAIHQVANALSEAVELPEMLGRGLERAVRALGLDGGQILLVTHERSDLMRLSTVFGSDLQFEKGEHIVRVGECICGEAAAAGEPVVVENLPGDPRVQGRPCAVGAIPSIASVPLKARGGNLGVLTVRSCDPHHFALRDVQLLTTIANLLAAALENARIRSDMEGKIAELTAEVRQFAIVQERERIGREMHDGLAQTLGLLNLQIELVKGATRAADWDAAERELRLLDEYLGNAYEDVREALDNLRNTAVKGDAFMPALRETVEEFGRRNDIEAALVIDNGKEPTCFPPLVELELRRVIQEALTNVRRHSGAARVELHFKPGSGGWQVTIVDDGVGFDANQMCGSEDGGHGLRTMEERVAGLGGRLSISSLPGAGTRVEFWVPSTSQNPRRMPGAKQG